MYDDMLLCKKTHACVHTILMEITKSIVNCRTSGLTSGWNCSSIRLWQ